MTLNELKAAHLKARKERDPYAKVIGTMLAELDLEERRGKVIGENEVVGKIRKYIKTAQDNIAKAGYSGELMYEITFLHKLLPQQITKDQIMEVFKSGQPTNIGDAMKLLRDNYAGRFDNKKASELAKQYIGA